MLTEIIKIRTHNRFGETYCIIENIHFEVRQMWDYNSVLNFGVHLNNLTVLCIMEKRHLYQLAIAA